MPLPKKTTSTSRSAFRPLYLLCENHTKCPKLVRITRHSQALRRLV
jgi:hypothetical protein